MSSWDEPQALHNVCCSLHPCKPTQTLSCNCMWLWISDCSFTPRIQCYRRTLCLWCCWHLPHKSSQSHSHSHCPTFQNCLKLANTVSVLPPTITDWSSLPLYSWRPLLLTTWHYNNKHHNILIAFIQHCSPLSSRLTALACDSTWVTSFL